MTTKTVLIAKVLPFRQKDDKFIEIKVKKLGNLSQFSDKMTENMNEINEKTKRKRERLDHLSNEEKIKRRKLHNRAAAQLARDRKKVKVNEMQHTINCLTKQKILLQKSNESLVTRFKDLEKENLELKQRLSQMERESKTGGHTNQGFVESAELIDVSQQQKHKTLNCVNPSTTPLIYLLAIMNVLMKSSNSSTTVPNNFSTQTSSQQNCQIRPQMTTMSLTTNYQNWSQSKT